MHKPVFALVDCNSFYASCEKLFRPDLRNRPVVVLSNNDGCIVARSAEAKALGVKMATPYFKVRRQLEHWGVEVFSSNYALYADISQRVMSTLETLAPSVEVYSIDEAFLDLTGVQGCMQLAEFGQQVRQRVYQWTGITTCVGIAPTKTLAKLANHAAKEYPATGGVVDLSSRQRQRRLMHLVPVAEVWGVGCKTSAALHRLGITTALQLADADPRDIRRRFSVAIERVLTELNGQPCTGMETLAVQRQQVLSSRSFASDITEFARMREAIAGFVAIAARKLRQQQQKARQLSVFIRNCPHRDAAFYSPCANIELGQPSNDSRCLGAAAHKVLRSIWQDGKSYKKGGVILSDLVDASFVQQDLFQQQGTSQSDNDRLMQTIDEIHRRGLGKVFLAAQGTQQGYRMRRDMLSPSYTTSWDDLPVVR